MNSLAPIALFVYNRPIHTKRTLECLQKNILANESDLFIFSDNAKTPDDEAKVKEVRSFIKTIKDFKKVEIIERDTNLGLANSIIDGVGKLTNEYGKTIVMEDDLESSVHALQYFNDALNFYQDIEKVMHIGGYMYPINSGGLPETFFFRVATSWGWATWKRAWENFEPDMEKLYSQFDENKIAAFSIDCSENFWKQVNEFRKGKINSWAIRWYASVFLKNGLALHPSQSLINNIGHDATGVHSNATNMYAVKVSEKKITQFPIVTEENPEAYKRIRHFYSTRKGSLFRRGIRFIKNKLIR